MVVAANTAPGTVELFITTSEDGIVWAERRKLADEDGESFYSSIIGLQRHPRETGGGFYVYHTFSVKGGWNRWSDALVVGRNITIAGAAHDTPDAADDR